MAERHRIAFLFPGQGSQFVGMGADLYRESEVVRSLFHLAGEAAGVDVVSLCLRGPIATLSRTAVLQPAITAVSLAACRFLLDRGVEPDAAVGHSLGEYSALACAGVLTFEDAVRVAAARGRCMEEAAALRAGTMVAVVGLPAERVEAEVRSLLDPSEGGVANWNAPDQVVLSGTVEAMERAAGFLGALGARCVPLAVSGAWHSELMAPAEAPFAAFLAGVPLAPPRIRVYLNATGEPAGTPETIREALVRQLRSPIRFVPIVERLLADGVDRFVEVGPGKVLRGLLRRILPDPRSYEVFSACDLPSLSRVVEALRS